MEPGAGRVRGGAELTEEQAGCGEEVGAGAAGRPAMIASCLCYLLLPAARLFRALSGTGPAS